MTSLHADEAFLDHYQFTHDPFAARVPGFKFYPAQRKPVLGQLHHFARYSQLVLVVAGPDGSGKTLLRQALVASTNKQAVQSVVVSAKGAEDPASILRQVAQGLQVARPDAASILNQVAQLALTGQEVYVLVDDAEDLSDAAISALQTLAAGDGEGRAHVFLFAESQLLARLEQFEATDEAFHIIELQPYNEDETREYLKQRLEGAAQSLDVFSDEQIAEIHDQSGGWPGGINQVAREVLADAMVERRGAAAASGGGFKLPRKHLLALCVVAVGVLAAWLMQGRVSSDKPAAPAVAQAPSTGAAGEAPAIQFEGSNQPVPLPLVGEAQPVIREPLAQASGMAEEGHEGGAVQLPPAVPVVPSAVGSAAAPAPAPVATPAPAPAPAPVVEPKPVVAAPKPPAPKPAPAPAPKPVVAAKPAATAAKPVASAGSSTAAWYAAQPGNQFALQVLVTGSESKAQDLLRKNGAQFHYYKKMHQGSAIYVVTYGKFASQAAAKNAISSLPAALQAGKPWARSFASIKAEAI
ncbi:AAA family ATPase [Pseudomonas sp. 5P_3.1_Bac2]|uniref:AAA family ATPase n=1 Tax=Pseudomonas sp. 5P_3.1_Bac2 TaxID=2971617 RepID=UPI0021C57756|nr:AAA family ATPase [Pseudomonas sp. 5P_3.1_Bac2]MCU1718398.1 AAA family ATPase [Pseudomonas sp. 5P_3.1_Bac2]